MTQVSVQKVDAGKTSPIFEKIAKRFEGIRQRAYDLFEKRGREPGHDVDDWLQAEHELLGWPAAELTEKDGAYEMQISLPGFAAKDIEVTAAPTEVVVHAASQEDKETHEGNVLWTEFGSKDVFRHFAVLNPINVDRVTASLDSGILRINAPEAVKPKEIKAATA